MARIRSNISRITRHTISIERILEDDCKERRLEVAWCIYQLAMRDDLLPRFTKENMSAADLEPAQQPGATPQAAREQWLVRPQIGEYTLAMKGQMSVLWACLDFPGLRVPDFSRACLTGQIPTEVHGGLLLVGPCLDRCGNNKQENWKRQIDIGTRCVAFATVNAGAAIAVWKMIR